jgi:hypothetical protein
MNTTKVLVGGVAAGAVFFLSDVGWQMVLGGRAATELAALGLGEPSMTPGMIAGAVTMNLALGLMIVWMYAAIRPRFGPGMRTATYAGLWFWAFAAIMSAGWLMLGIMSMPTYVMSMFWYLPFVLVAAWVGGRLYTEEALEPAAAFM